MSDVSGMESLLQGSVGPDTCCGCGCSETVWPSSETRPDSCDYGDTNSVADYQDNLHVSNKTTYFIYAFDPISRHRVILDHLISLIAIPNLEKYVIPDKANLKSP